MLGGGRCRNCLFAWLNFVVQGDWYWVQRTDMPWNTWTWQWRIITIRGWYCECVASVPFVFIVKKKLSAPKRIFRFSQMCNYCPHHRTTIFKCTLLQCCCLCLIAWQLIAKMTIIAIHLNELWIGGVQWGTSHKRDTPNEYQNWPWCAVWCAPRCGSFGFAQNEHFLFARQTIRWQRYGHQQCVWLPVCMISMKPNPIRHR